MNGRLDWLDIAKGLAIILMVIGHSSIHKNISDFIWTFHMPLFFIASGWCSNFYTNFQTFLFKRTKSLLIPFSVYGIIVLILMQVIGFRDWRDILVRGWDGYALWFIPVLYLSSLLARVVYSIKSKKVILIACLFVMLFSYVSGYFKPSLPWTLSSVPYATLFIIIGAELNEISKTNRHIERFSKKMGLNKLLLIFCSISFIITLIVSLFYRLDMCYNNVMPFVPITIGAISGTLFIYSLSLLIEKNFSLIKKALIAVGKETFIIVAFSQITIIFLNHYFSLNVVMKYLCLVIILVFLKYIKDIINKLLKYKIL